MENMHLIIGLALLAGLTLGSWLGQRKFASNATRIQRVEYRGRLFKVYDVTGLGWHLDEPAYKEAAIQDWERTMKERGWPTIAWIDTTCKCCGHEYRAHPAANACAYSSTPGYGCYVCEGRPSFSSGTADKGE